MVYTLGLRLRLVVINAQTVQIVKLLEKLEEPVQALELGYIEGLQIQLDPSCLRDLGYIVPIKVGDVEIA